MKHTITVLIADDHAIYLKGLKSYLANFAEIEVIGEASDGNELVEMASLKKPDVILTDLIMKNMGGVEAIKEITATKPHPVCIAISTFDSECLIVDALEAGALGYIIKNAESGEIVEAIKTVNSGYPYYCNSTSSQLRKLIGQSKFNPYDAEHQQIFSNHEKEIIRLVCEEKTNEEIGKELFMSKRTIEKHRAKILKKMNVRNTAGIAVYATKNFLIAPSF